MPWYLAKVWIFADDSNHAEELLSYGPRENDSGFILHEIYVTPPETTPPMSYPIYPEGTGCPGCWSEHGQQRALNAGTGGSVYCSLCGFKGQR